MSPSIMVVDDEKLISWSLEKELKQEGYEVRSAQSLNEARSVIAQLSPDVVLLDVKLPDGNGVEFLKEIRRRDPLTSVIMITANDEVRTAVQCMQLGAFNYLNKPFEVEEVKAHVAKALEARALRQQILQWENAEKKKYDLSNIVGKSAQMRSAVDMAKQVARAELSTVLIKGESGTGKDLIARAIHFCSLRTAKPFLMINCAAIPLTLLESELFGYEKGAFTDARESKRGLIEEASGGTLFLDEIGDMPKELQSKLLHLIDQKKYRKVGGTTEREADVRIIAATNKDLKKEVQEGRFREDLFYRLNVVPIYLAPLRERKDDIQPLVSYFVAHFNQEFRKNVIEVDHDAMEVLMLYDWPGNVRELRNVIERTMILNPDTRIRREHLPAEIDCHCTLRETKQPAGNLTDAGMLKLPHCLVGMSLDDIEKQAIQLTLERTQNNQSHASKLLGIGRDALRYKMQKYGFLQPCKENTSPASK